MRLPRDVSGEELANLLKSFGYTVTRQTGSHLRLTTAEHGEHHITIPRHRSLKIGTLNGILRDITEQLGLSKAELIDRLWRDG